MNRLLTIAIAILLGLTCNGKIRDLLDAQREWSEARYSGCDSWPEERLVEESVYIIADNVRDESAMRVLDATARFIPDFKKHVKNYQAGKTKKLNEHFVKAIEALSGYAQEKWPGTRLSVVSRMETINLIGEIIPSVQLWSALIEKTDKEVNAEMVPEKRMLLAMMKLKSFIQDTERQGFVDPTHYPTIFDLEKEAMLAFDHSTDPRIQIRMYRLLGILKDIPADGILAQAYMSESTPIPNRHKWVTRGGSLYSCNTSHYLDYALREAEHQLNPGHPVVIGIKRDRLLHDIDNYPAPEVTFASLSDILEWTDTYYPVFDYERASIYIDYTMRRLQHGFGMTDESLLRKSVETLEKYYGRSNPVYYYLSTWVSMAMLFIDEENEYWLKCTDNLSDIVDRDGLLADIQDVVMYRTIYNYGYIAKINHQLALEMLPTLYNLYLEEHSPNIASVLAGRELARCYADLFQNVGTAAFIYITVDGDLRKLYEDRYDNEPLRWVNTLDSFTTSDDMELQERGYDVIEQLLGYSQVEGRDYLLGECMRRHVDFKLSPLNDWQGAVEIMERCCRLPVFSDEEEVRNLTLMALAKQWAGQSSDSTYPIIEKALTKLNDRRCGDIPQRTMVEIANYLYNEEMFSEAFDMTNRALEVYGETSGNALSEEYLVLQQLLVDCLEILGERNQSRRILNSNIDRIEQSGGLIPTTLLLDYLWLDFNLAARDRLYDHDGLLNMKLQKLSDLTAGFLVNSGGNKHFKYRYYADLLSQNIHIMGLTLDRLNNDAQLARSLSSDQQSLIQNALTVFEFAINDAEEMYAGYKEYNPNGYKRSLYYRSLANALALWYSVGGKTAKGIEILSELATEDVSKINFQDHLHLAQMLIGTENEHKVSELLDRVENGIKDTTVNPDMLDLIGSLRIYMGVNGGYPETGIPYAREYFKRHKQELDKNFPLMTATEQENYMATHGDPAGYLLSLLEHVPRQLTEDAYDAIIYRTGMQLRSNRDTRRAIEQSKDPAVRELLDSIDLIRKQSISIPNWSPELSNEKNIANSREKGYLGFKLNRLQEKLLGVIEPLRVSTVSDVTWTQVRDRLRAGEAAVEFFFTQNGVMALVLKPGSQSPEAIVLCGGEFNDFISGLNNRNSAVLAKRLYDDKEMSNRMYGMLWRSLENSLKDVTTVYFTAPGILSTFAFNAFLDDEGMRLFDRYDLVQLTTTGQLVFDTDNMTPASIAMMGDIMYDEKQAKVSSSSEAARAIDYDFDFTEVPDDSRGVGRTYFRYLPFTAEEMSAISALFPGGAVTIENGLNATEPRFYELAAGHPSVLHLATHGYYISPNQNVEKHPFFQKFGKGNMQRSGFALSGAEKTWKGQSVLDGLEDGVVTASEVAELDLEGVQLIALSACETGLGDYSFEGVFGLQRGFKQAGAQSLLASLWSVNDKSTSIFMNNFYRNLLDGKSRKESWRGAVEAVRSEFDSPYYWAPFILLDGH